MYSARDSHEDQQDGDAAKAVRTINQENTGIQQTPDDYQDLGRMECVSGLTAFTEKEEESRCKKGEIVDEGEWCREKSRNAKQRHSELVDLSRLEHSRPTEDAPYPDDDDEAGQRLAEIGQPPAETKRDQIRRHGGEE